MKQKNGAKVLIMSPDKILLFHRDDIPTIPCPDQWQLVGGGIDDGETPEEALVREAKEEVCFDLINFEFIAKINGYFGEYVWFYVAFIDKDQEKLFVHGDGEGQEIGWFTIEESLKINLTPATRILIEEYVTEIKKIMKTRIITEFKKIIFYTTWRRDR
jgi:8-oxo-dGTP diphosphatase